MPQFPPLPTWDSLHPMIVHFPIVLLMFSPLMVLISAVLAPPRGRPYMRIGLLMLLLGTASVFVAAASGKAAAALAERGGPIDAVLNSHQELASEAEIVFSVLSAVLVGIIALPKLLKREESRLTTTWLPFSFLVLYCAGLLIVVNTAHAGARLVHEFGVHAIIPVENTQTSASSPALQTAARDERH